MGNSPSRVVGFLALLAFAACGGGGGSAVEEPAFDVPERPSSFADQGGLNQPPPDDWLAEVVVPRPFARPAPLAREEIAAAEEEALAIARTHLAARGFGPAADAVVTRVLRDEYASIHVKLAQTYEGLPVLDHGLAVHLHADGVRGVDALLVEGLSLEPRPVMTMAEAVADALGRYGSGAGAALDAEARLAVLPTLRRVRVRSGHVQENTDDFDRVLADERLVWEVVVRPVLPDVAALLAGRLAPTPDGPDADDADTDRARAESATRAGNEADAPTFEALTSAVRAPGIRSLYDAVTGSLLRQETLVDQDDFQAEQGIGHSYFHGTVVLDVARYTGNGTLYLHDIVRPDTGDLPLPVGTFVLDAGNVATHDVGDMSWIKDWNNLWGDGSILDSEGAAANTARRQTPAVDVAYAVQMTWDFLHNVLGRWGPAGDGTPTRACVHYDAGYTDAHYNRESRFICFGDGSATDKPGNYGLATVAHELGHAFWHAVGNGTDGAEARALNEGHGDIQGGLVDLYRNTGLGVGTQVRRFANFANWRGRVVDPQGYTEEDDEGVTHVGQKYWSASLEDKPEHVGGIPFARAFIYLAEGAPSDPDSTLWTTEFPDGLGGIGIARAAHIWRSAVAYHVVGSPDYAAMRTAFVNAAESLYGAGSMEHKATRRAFAAIRVGSSAGDVLPPTLPYAQVFAVNPKDMTALVFAVPADDTGFREVRVDGYSNHGVYTGDLFLGYASLSRAPVGTHDLTFTVEDSDGKTKSVSRPFLKVRDRNLIVNGDFEAGQTGWSTFSGDNPVSESVSRAFIGEGYLTLEGLDSAWQEVTIPATAEEVALVFRVLVRNSTKPGEFLKAQVQNTSGGMLQLLGEYRHDTPPDARNWLNKGYLRQEFDLSAYAGQTVRIAFVNLTPVDTYRFLVDQVTLTYVEDVTVGLPEVRLREWENTVQFTLQEISGLEPAEISRVDWYVDNVFVGAGPIGPTDYFGAYFLSSLAPGPHWVGGRVRGLDNSILKDTQGVWFDPHPFQELLVNGGFESGAWDLTYSDPPPKVQVAQNAPDQTIAFDGQRALRMGGQGDGSTTEAGQAVHMPQQMLTLDFSVRVKVTGNEDAPGVVDELRLELWNLATFQKIAEYPVADQTDLYSWQGIDEGWRGYVRKYVSIPPAQVNGKHVLLRLKTHENASKPTYFFLDNASLRHTQWGLQLGD